MMDLMELKRSFQLTDIWLHNWHRFNHEHVPVRGSVYVVGENAAGKTTLLDALQLVLVADSRHVFFNQSAQERRSGRHLDDYVRGKLGEDDYLRPQGATAYVVVGFHCQEMQVHLSAGVRVDAIPPAAPRKTFFLINARLPEEALWLANHEPHPRSVFRERIQSAGGQTWEDVEKYQERLRNQLGGLSSKTLHLLARAISFRPMSNLDEFLRTWLFPKRELNPKKLQDTADTLNRMRRELEEAEAEARELQELVEAQKATREQRQKADRWQLIAAGLECRRLQAHVEDFAERHRKDRRRQEAIGQELQVIADQQQQVEAEHRQALVDQATMDTGRRLLDLQRQQAEAEEAWRLETNRRRRLKHLWEQLQEQGRQAGDRLAAANRLPPEHALPEEDGEAWQRTMCLLEMSDSDDWLNAAIPSIPPLEDIGAVFGRCREHFHRVRAEAGVLVRQAETEARQVQSELGRIEAGGSLFPPAVERLREELSRHLGRRPSMLCELLEITDPDWQTPIEAWFGARRFWFVLSQDEATPAVKALLETAGREKMTVGILLHDAPPTPASAPAAPPPGSRPLREYLTTNDTALKAYLETMAGQVFCLPGADALTALPAGLSPECILRRGEEICAAGRDDHTPWFIGQRGRPSQIAGLRDRLETITARQTRFRQTAEAAEQLVNALGVEHILLKLQNELATPLLSLEGLEQRRRDLQSELESLDRKGLEAIEQRIRVLEARQRVLEQQRQTLETERQALLVRLGQQEKHLETLSAELETARAELARRQTEHAAQLVSAQEFLESMEEGLRRRHPGGIPPGVWQAEAQRARHQRDEAVRNYAHQSDVFFNLRLASNRHQKFQMLSREEAENTEIYAMELERLVSVALPVHQAEVARYQQELEQEIRVNILADLNSHIEQGEEEMRRLNKTLTLIARQPNWNLETYEFRRAELKGPLKRYAALIRASAREKRGEYLSLTDSAAEDGEVSPADLTEFISVFLGEGTTPAELQLTEEVRDYRSYLKYEPMVRRPGTGTATHGSSYASFVRTASGAEVQLPFYILMAAFFFESYRQGSELRTSRSPTMRLVIFDEAFSKMDDERARKCLSIFMTLNLQVIVAMPFSENSEMFMRMLDTTLLVSGKGTSAFIEPFVHMETAVPAGAPVAVTQMLAAGRLPDVPDNAGA